MDTRKVYESQIYYDPRYTTLYQNSTLEIINRNKTNLFIADRTFMPSSEWECTSGDDLYILNSLLKSIKQNFTKVQLLHEYNINNNDIGIDQETVTLLYSAAYMDKFHFIITFDGKETILKKNIEANKDEELLFSKFGAVSPKNESYLVSCSSMSIHYPSLVEDKVLKEFFDRVRKTLNMTSKLNNVSMSSIYHVVINRGDYELASVNKQNIKNKIDSHPELFYGLYGENGKEEYNEFIKAITGNKKGISILYGEPGTGKTSFIRKLITDPKANNKYFIFLDIQNIKNMPINVLLDLITVRNKLHSNKNCVLVIEDADDILTSRENVNYGNDVISSILNMSDGIFNDIYNIQFVFTHNMDQLKIDKAIKRESRLCYAKYFKKLSFDEYNPIYDYFDKQINGEHNDKTLAEIFSDINNDAKFDVKSTNKNIVKLV